MGPCEVVLALALIATVPYEAVLQDKVEVVRLQHFYDQDGKHVFDQLIWYDWNPFENRYDVVDWRLQKAPTAILIEDSTCYWHDGLTLRRVKAHRFYETWDQYDAELVERSVLPKEHRRELSKGPHSKSRTVK